MKLLAVWLSALRIVAGHLVLNIHANFESQHKC